MTTGLSKIGSLAAKGMGLIAAGIGAATTATVAFGRSAINTGKEFDAAMSQISATMGMTSDDIANNLEVTIGGAVVNAGDTFDALREKAIQMGSETNFSATQAAEGLNILAMSGFDAVSSMSMIEDVLHLAAAGGMDMAASAAYIAGSMKGFNDEAKDSAYYADLMAKGATLANTSVQQLGEAMSGGAATAAAYSQSADSMAISLLRLAEQGEVGSAASTALAAAMKDLYTPTDQAAGALKELGIAAYDSEGNARDFNAVVDELNAALSTMSDEEANAYKQTIFGIQGLDAFNKMTVTSVEKQEEWAAALATSSGEAAKQYDTMTDNLEGDIAIWNSALDGFKIALSDKLTPAIRDFVQFGSDSLSELTTALQAGDFEGVAEAAGNTVVNLLNRLTEMFPNLIGMGATILTTLINGISESLPQIADATVLILQTFFETVISAGPQLLEAGLLLIVQLAQGISRSLPQLVPAIVNVLLEIVDTLIDNIGMLAMAAVQLLQGLAEGLINALPVLIERLPEIIMNIVETLIEYAPQLIQAAETVIMTLAEGLVTYLPQLLEMLPGLIVSIVTALIENAPMLIQAGLEFITILARALITYLPQLDTAVTQIVISLVNAFLALAGKLVEVGNKYIQQIKDAIVNKWNELVSSVKQWVSQLISSFTSAISGFADVGKNIVQGIWNGIQSGWSWLIDSVKSLASNLLNAAKDTLGINSPSKEFAWIGRMCVAGFEEGTEDLMDPDAMTRNIMASLAAVQINMSGSGSFDASGMPGSFQQIINVNQQIATPDELARACRLEARYGLMRG